MCPDSYRVNVVQGDWIEGAGIRVRFGEWGCFKGGGRCDVHLQLMLAVLSSLLGPLQGPEGLAPV